MIQIISHTGKKILIDTNDVTFKENIILKDGFPDVEYTVKVSGMTFELPTSGIKQLLIKLIMKLAGMK